MRTGSCAPRSQALTLEPLFLSPESPVPPACWAYSSLFKRCLSVPSYGCCVTSFLLQTRTLHTGDLGLSAPAVRPWTSMLAQCLHSWGSIIFLFSCLIVLTAAEQASHYLENDFPKCEQALPDTPLPSLRLGSQSSWTLVWTVDTPWQLVVPERTSCLLYFVPVSRNAVFWNAPVLAPCVEAAAGLPWLPVWMSLLLRHSSKAPPNSFQGRTFACPLGEQWLMHDHEYAPHMHKPTSVNECMHR